MKTRIEELEDEEAAAMNLLADVRRHLRQEKLRLTKEATGFEEGGTIEIGGKRAIVKHIDTTSIWRPENPWAEVRYIRKDGRPADRSHNIFGLVGAGAKVVES